MGLTAQLLGLIHSVVTAMKTSLSALLSTCTEQDAALATIPNAYFSWVHVLRHQVLLQDEPPSPAIAKATQQHTAGPASVSTSVWPPEAQLPQAVVISAGGNKTTAVISPFKNSHTTPHEQGEVKGDKPRSSQPIQPTLHWVFLNNSSSTPEQGPCPSPAWLPAPVAAGLWHLPAEQQSLLEKE